MLDIRLLQLKQLARLDPALHAQTVAAIESLVGGAMLATFERLAQASEPDWTNFENWSNLISEAEPETEAAIIARIEAIQLEAEMAGFNFPLDHEALGRPVAPEEGIYGEFGSRKFLNCKITPLLLKSLCRKRVEYCR